MSVLAECNSGFTKVPFFMASLSWPYWQRGRPTVQENYQNSIQIFCYDAYTLQCYSPCSLLDFTLG